MVTLDDPAIAELCLQASALAAAPLDDRRLVEDVLTSACGMAMALQARSDRARRELLGLADEEPGGPVRELLLRLSALDRDLAELRVAISGLRAALD